MAPSLKINAYLTSNDQSLASLTCWTDKIRYTSRRSGLSMRPLQLKCPSSSLWRMKFSGWEGSEHASSAHTPNSEGKKSQHKSALSSTRKIPAEVIASFITFAIAGPDGHVGSEERVTFLRIRRVSQLWRSTAFSTPKLWRNVCFELAYGILLSHYAPLPIHWNPLVSRLSHRGQGSQLSITQSNARTELVSVAAHTTLDDESINPCVTFRTSSA